MNPRESHHGFGDVGALKDPGFDLQTASEVQVTFQALAFISGQASKIWRVGHVHGETVGLEVVGHAPPTADQCSTGWI